jgi:hypothetical protein
MDYLIKLPTPGLRIHLCDFIAEVGETELAARSLPFFKMMLNLRVCLDKSHWTLGGISFLVKAGRLDRAWERVGLPNSGPFRGTELLCIF